MMRNLIYLTMIVACVTLTGCKSKQKAAEVPPPEPIAPASQESTPEMVQEVYMPPPTEVAPPAPVPSPAPVAGQTYVVQRGDTLWSIATRYYGDGKRWQEIATANNIASPQSLMVGQTLIIP